MKSNDYQKVNDLDYLIAIEVKMPKVMEWFANTQSS